MAVTVPWDAFQVILLSALIAALSEGLMWLLFYRDSSYARQLEQLDRLGKRLEAAAQELADDPNNASKKKTHKRLEGELARFSLTLQGPKFKITLITGASMLLGMWLVNKRFGGTPVAKLPFVPFKLFANLTHLGLPGDDLTDCSAAFFYATTSPLFRANLGKLLGTGPSRTAGKYLNNPAGAAQTTNFFGGDKKSQ